MRTIVRGACPLDCPDTCSWLVEVEDGRAVGLRGDRAHPFTHGALCPKVNRYLDARQRARPRDAAAAPRRRQGRGDVRGDRLGRGARRDRRRAARRDRRARPRVRAARTTSRAPRAWCRAGSWARACSRALGASRLRDDDLHGRRGRRAARDLRRLRRHRSRGLRARAARDPVGRQPALDEPPPVALRARGAAARRARRRDRSAAHRHGRALRRAPRPAAGHRRRARARPHARRARRGRRGPRVARALQRGLARARGAPRRVAGRARGGDVRPPGREHRRARAPLRAHAPDRDPPRPRAAAPRRRGRGDARDPGAAGADGRLPPHRRRRAVHDRRPLRRHRLRARDACPPICPAPPARTINMSRLGEALTRARTTRRSPRSSCSTRTPPPATPTTRACTPASRARISSPSCSSSA